MNNSRGRNEQHSKKLGQFNRVAFKQCGEDLFDRTFDFDRQLKDKMAYANIQKNGGMEQRKELDVLEKALGGAFRSKSSESNLANDITNGAFPTVDDMRSKTEYASIFELLLAPTFQLKQQEPDKTKKRRRKKHSIDQGLGR